MEDGQRSSGTKQSFTEQIRNTVTLKQSVSGLSMEMRSVGGWMISGVGLEGCGSAGCVAWSAGMESVRWG